MPNLDLTYVYPFQRERFNEMWRGLFQLREQPLRYSTSAAAFILPRRAGRNFLGIGGIADKHGEMMEDSFLYGNHKTLYFGGNYSFDKSKVKKLDGRYIYLGIIVNHFGHMLKDCSGWLYATFANPNDKFLMILPNGCSLGAYIPQILRMLSLCGITKQNTVFINEPTQVEEIVIPERSVHYGEYYTRTFADTFKNMGKNVQPTITNFPEKVFFSRGSYFRKSRGEFGYELLDQLFSDMNYHVVYPESESLDNQIAYVQHAKEFALINGSLSHHIGFIYNSETKVSIVNKYPMPLQASMESCKIANIKPIYLDFYAIKYPVTHCMGPYLIINNDIMKKYTLNNKLNFLDNEFNSISYSRKCINAYLRYYYKNTLSQMANPVSHGFIVQEKDFNQLLYYDWLKNYVNYEDMALTPSYDHYLENLLYCKDKQHFALPELYHHICASLVINAYAKASGWLEGGLGSTSLCLVEPICALKMEIKAAHHHIFYQVITADGEWSPMCQDGEVVGDPAGENPMVGLRVWLGNLAYVFKVAYRTQAGHDWTAWVEDGAALLCPEGMMGLELAIVRRRESRDLKEFTRLKSESETEKHHSVAAAFPRKSSAALRLNQIANHFGCQTYLEIGVQGGCTFLHVATPHKTAVDPDLRLCPDDFADSKTFFFELKSDDFFSLMPIIQRWRYGTPITYDLIYLDGLHTFEQTMMDFVNSISYSNPRTIWVFNNTVPCDPWSALADRSRNELYRKKAGLHSGPWHGDIYKCVFALHDYFGEFSWCTPVDAENAQTIVWQTGTISQRQRMLKDMRAIKTLDYFGFLDMCHVLNPVRDAEALGKIGSNFSVANKPTDNVLDMLIHRLWMAPNIA